MSEFLVRGKLIDHYLGGIEFKESIEAESKIDITLDDVKDALEGKNPELVRSNFRSITIKGIEDVSEYDKSIIEVME